MKTTRWTVALYMALVFVCGGVVGAFAYRLYTVSGVSANVGQRNPEEFRKRFMADLKSRLQLNDDQAAKLGVIMDETRMRVRAHAIRLSRSCGKSATIRGSGSANCYRPASKWNGKRSLTSGNASARARKTGNAAAS